ncbi:hypothetical protein BDZ97DRAFT_1745881 [Flammula alnicola]|nr:hypothetical protein BDZ97DRAFT_1745881 [Flammula alnicola]
MSTRILDELFSIFHSPDKPDKGDTASTSNGIPANILAFRTITTILAQLPRSTPIEAIDNLEDQTTDPDARQELRISDAFAHLAVGEHDVAALTTNRSSPDSTELRVVACTNDKSLPISSTAAPTNLIAKFNVWYLMLTRNFSRDEAETSSATYPTIISPSEPNDLGERNAFAYMVGLELCWIKPSLSTHLWILSNILLIGTDKNSRQEFRSDLSTHLSRYTADMSYKKMARRFNNKNLSRPYIESLKRLKDIPLMSQPRRERSDNGHRRERDEADSDRLFLEDFVKLFTNYPQLLTTSIPNLIEMANNMPRNDDDRIFQLYTNETSTEFHNLLLELLDNFKNALDRLIALDKDQVTKGSVKAAQFSQNVGDLHRNGYALLRLSRGRAFQMHLENVGTLLEDPRPIMGASIKEHDEELEAIQSVLPPKGSDGVEKALLKSYVAWLRLMVGHFDAVEILVRYVTLQHFPYDSISIDILVAPPTDSALLPWSELFTDYKFLPKTGAIKPLSSITNDDIKNFLLNGIFIASNVKDTAVHAQNALKGWRFPQPEYQKTYQALQNLATSIDKNVREKATIALEKIQEWKRLKDDHLKNALANEIAKEIKSLHGMSDELSDSDRFFLNLNNKLFTGTLHCEACLATLLPAFTRDIPTDDIKYKEIKILQEMQTYGPVIGVSKRCCPACATFLKTLMKDRKGDFFVRGSHGTVSACTLPLWTPSNIVDSMNERFGLMLRQDLVTLMNEDKAKSRFRDRCKSTGSETLSLDSSEGSGGGFVCQALSDTLGLGLRHR